MTTQEMIDRCGQPVMPGHLTNPSGRLRRHQSVKPLVQVRPIGTDHAPSARRRRSTRGDLERIICATNRGEQVRVDIELRSHVTGALLRRPLPPKPKPKP
jgi:hypothetical protein